MAKPATDKALVQLATRLPASLLQRVKLWCVQHETSMQEFIAEALEAKLRRAPRGK